MKNSRIQIIMILAIGLVPIMAGGLLIAKRLSSPTPLVNNTEGESEVAKQLRECMPKSDMDSKRKCDQLIARIVNFEMCADAGIPVKESNPEQCTTPDGRTFYRLINAPTVASSSFSGKTVCLPHKDPGEVTTQECMVGFRDDNGKYYSLDIHTGKAIDNILDANLRLKVEGVFVPIELISSNLGRIYDVAGIIRVNKIIR